MGEKNMNWNKKLVEKICIRTIVLGMISAVISLTVFGIITVCHRSFSLAAFFPFIISWFVVICGAMLSCIDTLFE